MKFVMGSSSLSVAVNEQLQSVAAALKLLIDEQAVATVVSVDDD